MLETFRQQEIERPAARSHGCFREGSDAPINHSHVRCAMSGPEIPIPTSLTHVPEPRQRDTGRPRKA